MNIRFIFYSLVSFDLEFTSLAEFALTTEFTAAHASHAWLSHKFTLAAHFTTEALAAHATHAVHAHAAHAHASFFKTTLVLYFCLNEN